MSGDDHKDPTSGILQLKGHSVIENDKQNRIKNEVLNNLLVLKKSYDLMENRQLQNSATASSKAKKKQQNIDINLELLTNLKSEGICQILHWLLELYNKEDFAKKVDFKIIWPNLDKKDLSTFRNILVIWVKDLIKGNPEFFSFTNINTINYNLVQPKGERFFNFLFEFTNFILYAVSCRENAKIDNSKAIIKPASPSEENFSKETLLLLNNEILELNNNSNKLELEEQKLIMFCDELKIKLSKEKTELIETYTKLAEQAKCFFKENEDLYPQCCLDLLLQQENRIVSFLREIDPLDFETPHPTDSLTEMLEKNHKQLQEILSNSLPLIKNFLEKFKFLLNYLKNPDSFQPRKLDCYEIALTNKEEKSVFETLKGNVKMLSLVLKKIKLEDEKFSNMIIDTHSNLIKFQNGYEIIRSLIDKENFKDLFGVLDFKIQEMNLALADVDWKSHLKEQLSPYIDESREMQLLLEGKIFEQLLEFLPDLDEKQFVPCTVGGASAEDSNSFAASTFNATAKFESFLEQFNKETNDSLLSLKASESENIEEEGGKFPLASSTPRKDLDDCFDQLKDENDQDLLNLEKDEKPVSTKFEDDFAALGLDDISMPIIDNDSD